MSKAACALIYYRDRGQRPESDEEDMHSSGDEDEAGKRAELEPPVRPSTIAAVGEHGERLDDSTPPRRPHTIAFAGEPSDADGAAGEELLAREAALSDTQARSPPSTLVRAQTAGGLAAVAEEAPLSLSPKGARVGGLKIKPAKVLLTSPECVRHS